MLALDSDVCPTPVTRTVAPLNTYTFLKSCNTNYSCNEPKDVYFVSAVGWQAFA